MVFPTKIGLSWHVFAVSRTSELYELNKKMSKYKWLTAAKQEVEKEECKRCSRVELDDQLDPIELLNTLLGSLPINGHTTWYILLFLPLVNYNSSYINELRTPVLFYLTHVIGLNTRKSACYKAFFLIFSL